MRWLTICAFALMTVQCATLDINSVESEPSLFTYEGQYVVDSVAALNFCTDLDDCQEEVEGKTYLVTGIGEGLAVVRKEGERRIVPYDPEKDLCKTEFLGRLCEPNWVYRTEVVPNDPMYDMQWGLENIRAAAAWDTIRASNAPIAVIDSGVECSHQDLECIGEYDAIKKQPTQVDGNGHGTHVAGIISGSGNNDRGISGAVWAAPLLAVKFLGSNGSGSLADAITAIDWSIQNGARIINASWGCRGCFSQSLRGAIKRACDSNILFVAAAGNNGVDNDNSIHHYPSDYDLPCVVSVGAITDRDEKASYSNWGQTSVDVFAPGSSILSTLPNGRYGTLSGTSMATPFVSGASSLLIENGSREIAQVKSALIRAARRTPSLKDKAVSSGTLDLRKSLNEGETGGDCQKKKLKQCRKGCNERFMCECRQRRKCRLRCKEEFCNA